ncbi:maleylacetate reductase [Streptomyces neyagawaensis]|uniref:maleylacetate reductase n=1 Tax=Streptomyces neyagawaensis TaxID=42238 RepID=UPI0006E1ABDB|nr:maleylacetate reductase [Streptomyces neyagawaensis]MCL6732163.1 maleylacetate reductase [Streptomyces neyagawaensis]MDE1682342.1 maleylacetate reductase [Streptomyces neyagawaensis]
MTFTYEALPMRVVFGPGSLRQLPQEADRLGLRRLLVLSTRGQRSLAEHAATVLGDACAGLFTEARMHVPVTVAEAARAAAREAGADGCLAIGGGSTIGLGKAIALTSGLPVISVPTTYAGSEMTAVWGLTENGRKRTGRDRAALPRSVVYDPELTVGLPVDVSVTSGFNAIAHAVEALYAPDASPIVSLMAEEGVRSLAASLPLIAADPGDTAARTDALRGAWLCGACLGATTMSLHHKLCHILGGTFDLPHAATHTVLLPYVAAFNLPAAPAADRALRRALATDDVPKHLAHAFAGLGVPRSLAELGLGERDIDEIIAQAQAQPYANPRPVTEKALRSLLAQALNATLA